ncbi:MAG: PH domain-containing protein [Leptothrix sp. (in: b-proteobacteria)]
MSSYVEDALVGGERVVHLGRISRWSVWHLIALGTLLLPAFGLGLILWALACVRLRSTEVAVTTRRLIVKHGFIRRRTVEINLHKVESLQVDQGVWGRLLDHGTLVIAGTGSAHAPISGIAQPMAFRKAFIEAQEAAHRDA